MVTLKAIHQIRGVLVTKRKTKVPNATKDVAYSGDTFETDEDTAKSLIEGGNAVRPGENPAAADQTTRIANVYEGLNDEEDDDEEELDITDIAKPALGELKVVPEQKPVLTAKQKAAATKAKNAAAKKAGTPDPLGDSLLDDNGDEETVE